jgi:hypothetical protein
LEGLFCTSLKLASPEMHDGGQIGTFQFMQRMLPSFDYINGSEKGGGNVDDVKSRFSLSLIRVRDTIAITKINKISGTNLSNT